MTNFSGQFKEDVKHRTDIVALIGEHVNLKKSGKNLMACCPFHDEKTPSFSVSPEKQIYTCHAGCQGSGGSGDVFEFVMRKLGMDFAEALNHLAERVGMEFKPVKPKDLSPQEIARRSTMSELSTVFSGAAKEEDNNFQVLLTGHGLNSKALESHGFKLGYTSNIASTIIQSMSQLDNKAVQQAVFNGLIAANSHTPFFLDNSLTVQLSSHSMLVLDSAGNSEVIPPSKTAESHSLFGFNEFQSKHPAKQPLQHYYIALTPRMAMHLISEGLSDVIAPFNPSNLSSGTTKSLISRIGVQRNHAMPIYVVSAAQLVDEAVIHLLLDNMQSPLNNIVVIAEDAKASVTNGELIELPAQRFWKAGALLRTTLTENVLNTLKSGELNDVISSRREEFLHTLQQQCGRYARNEIESKRLFLTLGQPFGFNEADYDRIATPELYDVAQKRLKLLATYLGSLAINISIAKELLGDRLSMIPAMPEFLQPSEKHFAYNLAYFCVDALTSKITVKELIHNRLRDFQPEQPGIYHYLYASILQVLTSSKNSGATPSQVGRDAESELNDLMSAHRGDWGIVAGMSDLMTSLSNHLPITEQESHITMQKPITVDLTA